MKMFNSMQTNDDREVFEADCEDLSDNQKKMSQQHKDFVVKFMMYIESSINYPMDEFVGDRVFNLAVAKRLAESVGISAAKGAFGVYTSNNIMSSAMAELGLYHTTDMLSSDLEICCAIAHERRDTMFINMAVQIVVEYALKATGYNDEWFVKQGEYISKKEASNHHKGVKTKIDMTTEPIGQLIGYLTSNAEPVPEFTYAQQGDVWQCRAMFHQIRFQATATTKQNAKRVVAQEILKSLS